MQQLSTALRNAVNAGNPQRVLLKFGNEELSNEDIVMSTGVSLNEEFNPEEELTIGTCPSSTLSFDLLNDNGQLADFEFGWFTAYLGARIDSGTPTEITRTFTEDGQTKTYAFSPIGTFYAEKPMILAKKIISIAAFDKMVLLEQDMPSSTTLGITYPTTLASIFTAICTYLSVTYTSATFLNYDLAVSQEPKEFRNAKIRDVIGWIAECACSIARFNRNGDLELAWFSVSGASYNESGYSEFSPAWYATESIDGLYVRDTDNNTETATGNSLLNNYLILDNPFLKG